MMKTMRIYIKLMICCHVFFLGAASPEEIVTACGDCNYPPITYTEQEEGSNPELGREIIGVAPDVLRLIFDEIGITVQARYAGNWKRCQSNVEHGNVDILLGPYMTEERKKYAVFTATPLASDAQSIFVWKGREFTFEKWDDLKGRRVGVTLGYSGGKKFNKFLRKNTKLDRVSERLQNYRKLELGRIECISEGLYTGLINARKFEYEGRIVPLPTPVNAEFMYLSISKKSKYEHYLPQIEEGLKKLRADGTIDKLIKHHLKKCDVTNRLQEMNK